MKVKHICLTLVICLLFAITIPAGTACYTDCDCKNAENLNVPQESEFVNNSEDTSSQVNKAKVKAKEKIKTQVTAKVTDVTYDPESLFFIPIPPFIMYFSETHEVTLTYNGISQLFTTEALYNNIKVGDDVIVTLTTTYKYGKVTSQTIGYPIETEKLIIKAESVLKPEGAIVEQKT